MEKQKEPALILSKGFTIIELIVVIAIIAVLAAIVLVNVTQYINKSKNASIKANLAGLTIDGTIYFESDPTYKGSYQNFCNSSSVTTVQNANDKIWDSTGNITGTTVCNTKANFTEWCVCAKEIPATPITTFCVDYTGFKKENNNDCSLRCAAGIGHCSF